MILKNMEDILNLITLKESTHQNKHFKPILGGRVGVKVEIWVI